LKLLFFDSLVVEQFVVSSDILELDHLLGSLRRNLARSHTHIDFKTSVELSLFNEEGRVDRLLFF
jgi:hypothetical protein